MVANPRAGQRAQPEDLVDLPHLVTAYYTKVPDPDEPAQQAAFGTSGHRGSAPDGAFRSWQSPR
jgi:phosphoglucomutase